MSILSGQQLCYSIDGVDILKGVDIEVAEGEMIGLIGPNGAGKSTALRLMTQVETNHEGVVHLDGQPVTASSREALARRLGYLVQGAKAYWPVTVEKVVQLGRLPWQRWWQTETDTDKQCVEQAMDLTEVTAYRNRLVNTLSGGEQTLVMLARIFAATPQIIVADEPVAALDPYHQLHVMEILRNHAQGTNATVVVLHDLSLAARFCDRLYLLNHGEIFCHGTPEEVLSDKNLADVYGIRATTHCSEEGVSVIPVTRLSDYHP